MAARKKRDYLDDLDKPSLEAGRRLALTLLSYVRDVENVSAYASEPIDFEHEASRFSDSLECVNCGKEIDIRGTLVTYCSIYCQQIAGTVRYVRGGRVDKREPEIAFQVGIGDRLNHLPNGGYPARDRLLAKETREAIFKRDNYTCRICHKKPAQHVDHIKGSSNDPANLQAACADCNREKAFFNLRPATPEEKERIEELYINMAMRIASPAPSLACDDREHWGKTEPKIREARNKTIRELELKNHGLSQENISDFFGEVFCCASDADYIPTKYKKDVTCHACNNLIPKNTLYIRRSKGGTRACLDCIIDYRDGAGDEDVDGYVAHTMAKDD